MRSTRKNKDFIKTYILLCWLALPVSALFSILIQALNTIMHNMDVYRNVSLKYKFSKQNENIVRVWKCESKMSECVRELECESFSQSEWVGKRARLA